ncbi:hypothetical protein FHX41_3270 [Actinomadura hallensis]|uniref:Uncharacterized protein n=1 Tax=Actinomadura hallensis TaxID=337895 RepID=A0A543IG60_9ACTN|nr:hypothetical protein [Actinomadura hallensis]TQM69572.1 hypothetical protein FHX41_3270 [Actinomadura hallensis]
MPRQITTAHSGPSVPVLEHRIAVLERRVAMLTESVRALAAALGTVPPPPADGGDHDDRGDGDGLDGLDGGTVSEARPEPDLLPLGK